MVAAIGIAEIVLVLLVFLLVGALTFAFIAGAVAVGIRLGTRSRKDTGV